MTIGVVDTGIGNIGSVVNMLKKIGVSSTLIQHGADFDKVHKIILPGVGAFDNGINKIKKMGITSKLKNEAKHGKYILGICLGMQLLATKSEEGSEVGLNLIPGVVKKFPNTIKVPVPHMGWNQVAFKHSMISKNLSQNKFYFVHSYCLHPDDPNHIIGLTEYGTKFCSCVNKDNIYGVQFHPEKSHKYGMNMLNNFASLDND